jgi:segregation and condensation protein A
LEVRQEGVFPRLPVKPDFGQDEAPAPAQASLFDLINAVNAVLKRLNDKEDLRDIFEDKWTVSEKLEFIMQEITQNGSLRFSSLFASTTSRTEVVVTFLAMLELIRLKQIVALQESPFGEIELAPASPPPLNTGRIYAEAVVEAAQAKPVSSAHPEPNPAVVLTPPHGT